MVRPAWTTAFAALALLISTGCGEAPREEAPPESGLPEARARPSVRGGELDGEVVWRLEPGTSILRGFRPGEPTPLESLRTGLASPRGLTWDATHLWTIERRSGRLCRIDPETGEIVRFLPLPREGIPESGVPADRKVAVSSRMISRCWWTRSGTLTLWFLQTPSILEI